MRWWEQSLGGAAKGRIIGLLRRGRRTVDELAESSGVTDNAVRAQLRLLEGAGVVRAAGTRQGDGAGKPATVYEIAPAAEPVLSSAYAPVLAAVLETLAQRLPAAELEGVMRESGRRLGAAGGQKKRSLESRVTAAADVLTGLGAEIDVERMPGGYRLRGYACPLSAVVGEHPMACQVVEELVAELVGAPTRECCDRTNGARCRFEIKAS
ncbi:MAG: ArsR family transcriptional regulator [Gemmatimonadota bacterium]|nr:ArsR family transcriptional regulator [Gemmatimonadota bacterium]